MEERKISSENQAAMVSQSRRPSLKSESHLNKHRIWKEKLRENCCIRVREDRTRLLWKMRLTNAHLAKPNQEDVMKSTFFHIVSDELKKIKDVSLNDFMRISSPNSESDINDVLWEYDGFLNAYQGECEDIMLEMQRIFYEDLRAEPNGKAAGVDSQIARWEEEEDEYLAHAVYEHMELNEDQTCRKELWCPVCKEGKLKEDCRRIHCSGCELQLNKANELNLDLLRERLAETHSAHLDRGCRLKPRFSVETRFNITALYMMCEGCDAFEVVI